MNIVQAIFIWGVLMVCILVATLEYAYGKEVILIYVSPSEEAARPSDTANHFDIMQLQRSEL